MRMLGWFVIKALPVEQQQHQQQQQQQPGAKPVKGKVARQSPGVPPAPTLVPITKKAMDTLFRIASGPSLYCTLLREKLFHVS